MTKVQEIEVAVKSLNKKDMRLFRGWFYEYDNELWDKKISIDQKNENSGIAKLARIALMEHRRGKSTAL